MNKLAVQSRQGSQAAEFGASVNASASPATFGIFIFFLIDFFLHLSARFSTYALLRPTLLLVLIITISLYMQREKFRGWTNDPIVSALLTLLVYLAITVLLVEWPGSVIRNNLSDFVKAIVFFFACEARSTQ